MKMIKFPNPNELPSLLRRPVTDNKEIRQRVGSILEKVRAEGDSALLELTEKFDRVKLTTLKVSTEEIEARAGLVTEDVASAMVIAKNNIERFHSAQREDFAVVETSPGIRCWRKGVPMDSVGLYVPGGTAPLFSSLLMLGVPAALSGCQRIVLCTPPSREGRLNPEIALAAKLVGVNEVYLVGGAQAVAALAYGTESIAAVNKIFGPGNSYVTLAKEIVSSQGTAIDLPAGPSEALVLADEGASVRYVVADLLAQAEHGADSQVVLVTDSPRIFDEIPAELERQIKGLPRSELASQAISISLGFLVENLNQAVELSNAYAPEHLLMLVREPATLVPKIRNAGSVFLGDYSVEAVGDYASGTNHTLPTNGWARSYAGISLDSFLKKITFQEITAQGLEGISKVVSCMARAEGLEAHARAVEIRNAKNTI